MSEEEEATRLLLRRLILDHLEVGEMFAQKDEEIARLKKLCVEAAAALESTPLMLSPAHQDLVMGLRKAASAGK